MDGTTPPMKPPVKPHGSKRAAYSELTTDLERWAWHAWTYAWRRVWLGVADAVHTSPCDPEGKWFDEKMVDTETQRLRADLAQRHRRTAEPHANHRYRRAETWRRLGGSNWEHQQLARLAEAAGYESWQAYFALDETGARRTHARWQHERNRILEEA